MTQGNGFYAEKMIRRRALSLIGGSMARLRHRASLFPARPGSRAPQNHLFISLLHQRAEGRQDLAMDNPKPEGI